MIRELHKFGVLLAILLFSLVSVATEINYSERADVQAFIQRQVAENNFDEAYLKQLFAAAQQQQAILDAIAKPAEKTLQWKQYRNIFITEDRIAAGRQFMQQYQLPLARAEKQFGVPPQMIAAIIGVETRYGKFKGRYRVLDALATLAFDYPPRSRFFTSELEQYLLMVREQQFDPLSLQGSYAGAMGYGQFISSSYRAYAVDFDDDGVVDIIDNPVDAIGSVANYFKRHGWQAGAAVVLRAAADANADQTLPTNQLKPGKDIASYIAAGYRPLASADPAAKATLLQLQGEDGLEYWLGLDNFYVISRYNHSHLYVMAVWQLAQALAAEDAVATE